jgi:hypothetical protein
LNKNKKIAHTLKERRVLFLMEDKEKKPKNTTKYGEFVTSYFAWLPIEKQKEKAEEMNEMTKEGGKEGNDI